MYALIAERCADSREHDDLLGMLLAARDEETGQGMSDRELRDEVLTMLLAGHETTATSASWALALLAAHPGVMQRLHREVDSVLHGEPPRADDLPRLPYARAILDETLRLYPSSWVISRQALLPDQLGPYSIPAGAAVMASPYANHRLPHLWTQPNSFLPERWLDAPKPALFTYFPFGAGLRMCVGQHLAMLELNLLLIRFAQRCTLNIDGPLPKPLAGLSIHPDRRLTAQVGTRCPEVVKAGA